MLRIPKFIRAPTPPPPRTAQTPLGLLFRESRKAFQTPRFPSCPWIRAAAATIRADGPRGQGDFLAPACQPHLVEQHPAICASEPRTVAPRNLNLCSHSALKDALYMKCLFILKLCKRCHITRNSSLFFSPDTPTGIFFHQLLLNFLALLWIGVNCSPRKWLQRNLPSKEKRRTQVCRSVSAFLFDPKWTHILYGGWTVY